MVTSTMTILLYPSDGDLNASNFPNLAAVE